MYLTNGYLIFLILLIAWAGVLLAVRQLKSAKHISLYGPTVMLKTEGGIKLIERASKTKFWIRYGDFAIVVGIITMIATTGFIAWEATLVFLVPKSSAPSIQTLLAIPGLNPLIPLSYGLISIIIGVVLHELSHGLVAASQKLKVKTVGALLFIVPIGAFVELDEKELNEAARLKRMRVQAAGTMTNLVIASVMLLLFLSSFSGVTPIMSGAVITQTYHNVNPGLHDGMEIVSLGDAQISVNALDNIMVKPGVLTNATIIYNGKTEFTQVYPGVTIIQVFRGTPAAAAGLQSGDLIVSINGTTIYNEENLSTYLDATKAGQSITLDYLQLNNQSIRELNATMILMNKYTFYASYQPSVNSFLFNGTGFMGISTAYMGLEAIDASTIPEIMSNPFNYTHNLTSGALLLLFLPYMGLSPLPNSITQLYRTPLSPAIFWPLINTVYWLFWINLLLGMTNLLPLLPFDGGYIFKDTVQAIAKRLGVREDERTSTAVALAATALIVGLFVWLVIGPLII
ncbi:MAG: site-2 protease family protein [Conexivisphaerales archaeon]